MNDWWTQVESINRAFYGAAAFFGVFFIWQLISAFMGLDTDSDTDGSDAHDCDLDDVDGHGHHDFEHGAESDGAESTMAFKLLSVRSIITFFTLFTWGTALYLDRGDALGRSMGISSIWGLAGMLSVALFFFMLPKLTHTGTKNIASTIGNNGTVYLDIPAGGRGEVRIMVTGSMSHVDARAADGKAIKAGTPVTVTKQLDNRTIEVTNNTKGSE